LVRETGLALITAGVVVLLFLGYELVGTNFTEEHSQARLAQAFNAAVSRAPTSTTASGRGEPGRKPAPGKTGPGKAGSKSAGARSGSAGRQARPVSPLPVPPPGGALDHLVIPAIGVDRYVVQGVGEAQLQMGPGHYPGTALPGQTGNVAIAGHRTTFGAPFFELNQLGPGDLIYLTDVTGTTWVYDVTHQWVVAPSDVSVLDATRAPVLTLTTCNPRFEATSRLVVRAVLVRGLPPGTRLAGGLPTSLPGPQHGAGSPVPTTAAPPPPSTTSSPGTTTTAPGATTTAPRQLAGGPDSPTVGAASGRAGGTGDRGALWVGSLGWGYLAVQLWVGTRLLATRRYRWAKVAVVASGALVCLVPLWFAFENAVNLLPANF
jgi:sortase A